MLTLLKKYDLHMLIMRIYTNHYLYASKQWNFTVREKSLETQIEMSLFDVTISHIQVSNQIY